MADRHDRPDDSNAPRHTPGSVNEETSALGQRVKGKIKEEVGDAIDAHHTLDVRCIFRCGHVPAPTELA